MVWCASPRDSIQFSRSLGKCRGRQIQHFGDSMVHPAGLALIGFLYEPSIRLSTSRRHPVNPSLSTPYGSGIQLDVFSGSHLLDSHFAVIDPGQDAHGSEFNLKPAPFHRAQSSRLTGTSRKEPCHMIIKSLRDLHSKPKVEEST